MNCLFLTSVCLAVLLVVGSSLGLAAADPLVLVQDGRANATIVLAAKPTGSAQLAAFELQHHIKKISGATLPIVREPQAVEGIRILVGESVAARKLGYGNDNLKEQEYVIKTFPNTLLLIGYDRQYFEKVRYEDSGEFNSLHNAALGMIGTCYAVHDFLENTLGVRWYYPNEEIGEVVPVSSTIGATNLNIRRSPDAPIRNIYPLYTNSERLYFTDVDQRQKFQKAWVNPRVSLLYWIRNRHWGGMIYNANHSFDYHGDAFGQSHPEWFSTKSYERMKQRNYSSEVQPCLTAPGFFEHVGQTARDYFDGKPEPFPRAYHSARGNFFPIVLNDNTNMCGCPTCRAQYRAGPGGNASHYLWGFANRVAREVRKTHPNAMISGLAYFNYTLPPKGLVFEPNVAVTFCKFYEYYHDKNYQERDYRRIGEYVNDNKAKFFVTWEYLCHPFLDRWPFPCMVPHVQADDVRRLSRMGGFMGGRPEFAYWQTYKGGYAQVSPVLDFMNLYWRMKLHDDFKFDFEQRLAEYYEKFFGPGAEGMEKFYSAMENRWMTLGGGNEARSWWGKLGTREFLKELAGYIAQARQATKEGTLYRRRVELIDAGIMQYMLKARERYEGSAMTAFAPVGTAVVARVVIPAGKDWADDATWAEALDNVIEKTIDNEPAPQQTVFRLAYDDKHLYIKAKMSEPYVKQMKATVREKDIGGFSDDSIELFFDPGGKGQIYYQFCINSLGAVYEAMVDPYAIGATDTITWDSGATVKTAAGKDHWELRAAVPLGAFVKEPPRAGETWRFNLCRNRHAERDKAPFSAWSPALGGFRNPERFGVITFNAPEEMGRTLWNCGFQSSAFATDSGESPLIGLDGWYENTSYANQGWDKSWKVVKRGDNRLAVCDVNKTNHSDMVPVHTVDAQPGKISVEAMFRRHAVRGNMPTIQVYDLEHRCMVYMYAREGGSDLVAIEKHPDRRWFGKKAHGLGDLAAAGKWFGLKAVIDTKQKAVIGYAKSDSGQWVQLNETPIPYLNPKASGTTLCVSVGSRKHKKTVENNILEMDNIRVMQISPATAAEE